MAKVVGQLNLQGVCAPVISIEVKESIFYNYFSIDTLGKVTLINNIPLGSNYIFNSPVLFHAFVKTSGETLEIPFKVAVTGGSTIINGTGSGLVPLTQEQVTYALREGALNG